MATEKKTKRTPKKKASKKADAKKVVDKTAAKKRTKKAASPPKAKPLKPEKIEYFTQLLLEKRSQLVGDVDRMGGGALDSNRQESSGDLSNMPIHMADIGTDNYEQEFTLDLIESERKLLREIDRALIKIREGNYGICEGTGEPINQARLEAKPEARYCVEYARKIEQGLVTPLEENAPGAPASASD
ncbi:TraR/DksA family transcriptional regulator [Planctomycetota bacterium]